MSSTDHVPLHHHKAELYRTLGHPVRIRVLELLEDRPRAVRELLGEIEVESSNLSQQLAVLRRVGLVASARSQGAVVYSLAADGVAGLLQAGRDLLEHLPQDEEDNV